MNHMTKVVAKNGDTTAIDLSQVAHWDWLAARAAITIGLRNGAGMIVVNDDRAPRLRALLEHGDEQSVEVAVRAPTEVPAVVGEHAHVAENPMLAAAAAAGAAAPDPERAARARYG